MQMNLLALWTLLLIQMPTAFMSDMPSSEDSVIKLAKRKRDDRSSGSLPEPKRVAGSSHEQPVERVQAQLNWMTLDCSGKEKVFLCEKLKETTVRLRLSLATEEDLDPTKLLCGLRLNPQATVDANIDEIIKGVFYDRFYVNPYWVRKSERGNILILPFEGYGVVRRTVQMKERRYVIDGGVAEILDRRLGRVAYIDFTANANGISADGFKHVEFEAKPAADHHFIEGLGNNRIVPKSITSLEDNSVYLLSLKYLFYEDVGSLEAPYPIPHLGLSNQLLTDEEVAQALQLKWVDWRVPSNGVGLIRLVQLWKELNPDHEFKHLGLKKLNEQLEALSDDATESEKKELLLAACDLILQSNADDKHADGMNGKDLDWYFFLQVLIKEETKVGESFAIELDDNLVPKKPIDEAICNELLDKIAFYHGQGLQNPTFPYEIEIICQGQPLTFRVIARIGMAGTLFTYGTDYDSDEGGWILKMSDYSYFPARITYLPIEGTTKVLFSSTNELFIYQYVSDEKRTRGVKVALPTD